MIISKKKRIIELEQDNRELQKELEKYQRISLSLTDMAYQYKAILDSFNGFIYISSPDYVIEFMNDKFTDRIGKYLYGTKCYFYIFGRDRKCTWCINDEICKGESSQWQYISHNDNKRYHIINKSIEYYENYTCNITIIQDITSIDYIGNEKNNMQRVETAWNLFNNYNNDISSGIRLSNLNHEKIANKNHITKHLMSS
jgi:PAS domain-containing protein